MSDMTIESAKRKVECCREVGGACSLETGGEACHRVEKAFLEGHASRDPEVADMKIKLLTLTNNAKGTPWTEGEIEAASSRASQTERILELSAEVENLKKDLALNASLLAKQCDLAREADGEVNELRNSFDLSQVMQEGLEKELSAEREASSKLAEAAGRVAKHVRFVFADDFSPPSTTVRLVRMMEEPLKFYATPGHSPEGE